jgi:hypothetical protein
MAARATFAVPAVFVPPCDRQAGPHRPADAAIRQYPWPCPGPAFRGKARLRRLRLWLRNAKHSDLDQAVAGCHGSHGARDLFGNAELVPVKGQLGVLLPQPEVTYNMPGDGTYAFPRHDGVVLGGTEQREVWSLNPDPAEVARVLETQKRVFASLRCRESVTASA